MISSQWKVAMSVESTRATLIYTNHFPFVNLSHEDRNEDKGR